MDAAAYGVIGACFGAGVTGLVTIVTARTNARLKVEELMLQERRAQRELDVASRKERAQRYAAFLSAFWQEERFASEMIEHLSARRAGWSDAIRRINTSPQHHQAIATLNDSMGWLSVLCHIPAVEREALVLSAQFDKMMELFGEQLNAARTGDACDPVCVADELERLRAGARELSSVLRRDLGVNESQ
jgi:hypothetical protein